MIRTSYCTFTRTMNAKQNSNSLLSAIKILANKQGWRENKGFRDEAIENFFLTTPFRLSENVGNAPFICQYYWAQTFLKQHLSLRLAILH